MQCLNLICHLVLVLLAVGRAFGEVPASRDMMFSPALGEVRRVDVFLPTGYDAADPTVRYPVIYFLHGASLGLDTYSGVVPLILSGVFGPVALRPSIIVLPDGDAPPYEGSFYTNSELYGSFEDYIVADVVSYIDSTYNTIAVREGRALIGHSMGGFGAMKLGLKHPDVYRAVAAHSGPLDFNRIEDMIPSVLAENGSGPPYSYVFGQGAFTDLTFSMAGAFSPNISQSPPIDFPLNDQGVLIDSVFARWQQHNPAEIAATLAPNSNLAIYFDCGTEDELLLFPLNTSFKDSLIELGIPFRFEYYSGGHADKIIDRILISLAFVDSVFGELPVSVPAAPRALPRTVSLLQNYPNPFNPSTTFEFLIDQPTHIRLRIFNLLGQEVETLLSKQMSDGRHRVAWNARGLPGGIYFYRLEAGDFTASRRLILLR